MSVVHILLVLAGILQLLLSLSPTASFKFHAVPNIRLNVTSKRRVSSKGPLFLLSSRLSGGNPRQHLVLGGGSKRQVSTAPSSTSNTNQDDQGEENESHIQVQDTPVIFTDLDSFNTELKCIASSSLLNTITSHMNKKKSAPRYANEAVNRAVLADELLHWMIELEPSNNSPSVRPDARSYNITLRAWKTAVMSILAQSKHISSHTTTDVTSPTDASSGQLMTAKQAAARA